MGANIVAALRREEAFVDHTEVAASLVAVAAFGLPAARNNFAAAADNWKAAALRLPLLRAMA